MTQPDACISFSSLRQVRRPDYINKQIEIRLRVAERGEVSPVPHEGKIINTLPFCIVEDHQCDEIQLLGVAGDVEVDRILQAHREHKVIDVIAEVVVAAGVYKLSFIASRNIESVLQLVGAQPDEVSRAEATVLSNSNKPGGVLKYIRESCIALLRILHVAEFPALRRAVDAAILQSVCQGRINETPAYVSLLLVGPPGTGKRIVHRVAKILSPVFNTVSSNSVTPAGLVGTAERRNDRTLIHPGALGRSHWGVVSIEDLQSIDTYSYRHTFGILSDMLERGHVCRTTYRDVDLPIEAGLVCDTNPKSTMRPSHSDREIYFVDDLNLPLNFLSRIDVAIAFERDTTVKSRL